MTRTLAVTFTLLLGLTAALAQLPTGNLVVNGDFQKLDAQGWATGWGRSGPVKIATENGNSWLVISGSGGANQTLKIDPAWSRLKLSLRMKTTDVVMGKEGWMNARLAMEFRDAQDKHLDPWPNVVNATGTTPWTTTEREYRIPEGAVKLHLGASNLGVSGTVEFDDISFTVTRLRTQAMEDAPVPSGVANLWDLNTAARQKSATRESICLNDLWRFLPLNAEAGTAVPGDKQGWCWFKVPGLWPNENEGGAQKLWLSDWAEEKIELSKVDQAWYKRELTVPADWRGRRVWLDLTMLQTAGRVCLDGKPVGELWFPGGRLELTSAVTPGQKQELAILVTARPTESESRNFMAPDRVIATKSTVNLKGLTGDVFLVSEPTGDRLGDVHVITSVTDKRLTFDTAVPELGAGTVRLLATVMDAGKPVRVFQSPVISAADLQEGRYSFSGDWPNPKLWDTDTPQNIYDVVMRLESADGKLLDESLPERFGFREFKIVGRDFLLNGKPIHLRALLVPNPNQPADVASFSRSLETCRRLKQYGFNFFITGNYNFRPGEVGYLDGMLKAADESGMLWAFSLPHLTDFKIDPAKPETLAAYRTLSEYLIRRVQNHPGVVMYAMNHNATGYYGDQNPLKIDGLYNPEGSGSKSTGWSSRNRQIAPLTAAVAKSLDPTRPVYHHQSGNLGDMHTVNIYLNWAPRQERSDWLEHWATVGTKPVFFVEWGLPHISSWSSFRGPEFIWRYPAFQSCWDSEFAADYVGQDAYRMTPLKVKSLQLEEELWAKGQPFQWGQLIRFLGQQEENYLQVQALMAGDNWRSHRTWGLSSGLPWDQGGLWRRDPQAAPEKLLDLDNALAGLQQPGIAPDRVVPRSDFLTTSAPEAIQPTSLGRCFLRWNQPLCAYLGGGPKRFTDKAHNFLAGETVRKQLVILNDTRRETKCRWAWRLDGGKPTTGTATVPAGGKTFVPVEVKLTGTLATGPHTLAAKFTFADGTTQEDSLKLDVLPAAPTAKTAGVALFDPVGQTAKLLDRLGVKYTKIAANADLSKFGVLVIGREALTPDGPAPDLSRVREGLKVLVFEQSYETLTQRLGFRANVHGMRQAYVRTAHPALAGLSEETLRDWRGAATLVEPYLKTDTPELTDPKWNWMGFINTRVWRCGNNGNVASVLIEKPSRGGFTPLVDCGFDLQYAPLLEYAEGKGRVIFCQLDVNGRSESDPAADRLCVSLLSYLGTAAPATTRPVLYAGDERGATLLRDLGVPFAPCTAAPMANETLVLGPDAPAVPGLEGALQSGAKVLALGLSAADLQRVLPGIASVKEQTLPSQMIAHLDRPEYAGLSNSDLHWHTVLTFPALPETGADRNAALAVIEQGKGRVVLCQAAPWLFDTTTKPYVRTTYRRNVFLVARLLSNLGAASQAPVLEKLTRPAPISDWPLPQAWRGKADPEQTGEKSAWQQPNFDDTSWTLLKAGATFEAQIPELEKYDGVFWYRLRFRTPPGLSRDQLTLWLGPVDDESKVWLNGKFLGEVNKQTNPQDYWSFPRVYPLSEELLYRDRENVLVVRVLDTFQSGGLTAEPRLTARPPWLTSYYLQTPVAGDDPYRYYRW